jgi:hypothetical protein
VLPDTALAKLKDIHLPEPTSWWPPAPGWWLLALLLLLSPLLWRWLRQYLTHRRQPRYRSAALRELDLYYQQYQQQKDSTVFIQSVSALLKRVAMQCYSPDQVASLSGEQWGEFLGRDQSAATIEDIKATLSQAHSRQPHADTTVFYRFARQWIEARETF